jgi:hypothetical protein
MHPHYTLTRVEIFSIAIDEGDPISKKITMKGTSVNDIRNLQRLLVKHMYEKLSTPRKPIIS